MRRITDKLTYANVVASLALFIALGGASYAAVRLPAYSVGPRQLRSGAVEARALGFPLGVHEFRYTTPIDEPRGLCVNEPGRPIACERVQLVGGAKVGEFVTPLQTRVALTAIVELANEAPPGTTFTGELALFAGRHRIDRQEVAVPGRGGPGGITQVVLQGVAEVGPGGVPIELGSLPLSYSTDGPGDAHIESVSVIATEVPAR